MSWIPAFSWRNGAIAGVIAIALTACGGCGYYLFGGGDDGATDTDTDTNAVVDVGAEEEVTTSPTASTTPAEPTSPSGSGEPAATPTTTDKVAEAKETPPAPLRCDPSGSTTVRSEPQVTTAVGTDLVPAGKAYLGIRGRKITCSRGDDDKWTVRNDGTALTIADLSDDLLRKVLKTDQRPIDSDKGWSVLNLLHGQKDGELAYYIK